MRADRLVATLLLLQRRQRVTAGEVAAELEVSERTARRDLEALCMAGLPLYAERGRHGGWRLLGGGRTDLSGLTAAEATALFLVAGPSAAATPELRAALRKLVAALPEPFRARAELAAGSVVVDPGAWGEDRRANQPPHLADLQQAVAAGERLHLGYRDRAGAETGRVMDPLGLALKGTVWYLVAGTDDGLRTFRVSRVTSITRTGEPVRRPEGFDLAETWKTVVERVDDLRGRVEVVALAEAGMVPLLAWVFERHLLVGAGNGDGRVEVTVRGHRVEVICAQLAGFGRRVEVVSPPEARLLLAEIGAELAGLYASVAGVRARKGSRNKAASIRREA